MIDERTFYECKKFINDKVIQRRDITMGLKMELARERRYVEVGQKLARLEPFFNYFQEDILKKFETDADFYNYVNISRQVFSNMRKSDYDPNLDTVYKILIGLEYNLLDSVILMENAGYTFTFKTKKQLIIIFCILNEIHEPADVDELLTYSGAGVLFSSI